MCRLVISILVFLAISLSGLCEEESRPSLPGFAVVHIKDYKYNESYSVLSRDEYNASSTATRLEARVIRKATNAARNEWIASETKRVGSRRDMNRNNRDNNRDNNNRNNNQNNDRHEYTKRGFPTLKVNRTPGVRCVGLYKTKSEADAKCASITEVMAARKTKGGLSRTRADGGTVRLQSKIKSKFKKAPLSSSGGSKNSSNSSAERNRKSKEHLEEARVKTKELFEKHYARIMADVEEFGVAGLNVPDPEVDDGKEKKVVKKLGSALESRLLTNPTGFSEGKSSDKNR